MREYVQVLRAEDYFETYARNGIGKGMDRILVRRQMIDAFRKEIFGLVAMRGKKHFDDIPIENDPEAIRIARNVIRDETKKWIKICKMFEKYRETRGLLKYDDISVDENDAIFGSGNRDAVIETKTDLEKRSQGGVIKTKTEDLDIPIQDTDGRVE